MKHGLFSVRDIVADQYQLPFCDVNPGSAIRSFQMAVNRSAQDNMLWLHPDDYELFQLGEFDTWTAKFVIFDKPVSLMLGRNAKAPEPAPGIRAIN